MVVRKVLLRFQRSRLSLLVERFSGGLRKFIGCDLLSRSRKILRVIGGVADSAGSRFPARRRTVRSGGRAFRCVSLRCAVQRMLTSAAREAALARAGRRGAAVPAPAADPAAGRRDDHPPRGRSGRRGHRRVPGVLGGAERPCSRRAERSAEWIGRTVRSLRGGRVGCGEPPRGVGPVRPKWTERARAGAAEVTAEFTGITRTGPLDWRGWARAVDPRRACRAGNRTTGEVPRPPVRGGGSAASRHLRLRPAGEPLRGRQPVPPRRWTDRVLREVLEP